MEYKSEIERDMQALLQWFEERYTPEMNKGAELVTKGLRGNVVIKMYYEK